MTSLHCRTLPTCYLRWARRRTPKHMSSEYRGVCHVYFKNVRHVLWQRRNAPMTEMRKHCCKLIWVHRVPAISMHRVMDRRLPRTAC